MGMGFSRSTRSSPAESSWWCQMLSTLDSLPSTVSDTTKLTGHVAGASVASSCPPCFSEPRVTPNGRMQCRTTWMMSLRLIGSLA